MTINRINVGDYVVDPIDGSIRRIILIDNDGSDHWDDSVYLADGGVMRRSECTDILLESEVTG
ncbi:MAG: hypothetical protein OXI88_04410 [Gammaproteobacteria bacterium]|nr:hypothetical protein [Gammaproteobacteria bacterium]